MREKLLNAIETASRCNEQLTTNNLRRVAFLCYLCGFIHKTQCFEQSHAIALRHTPDTPMRALRKLQERNEGLN